MLDKQKEKLAVHASTITQLFALRTVPRVIALRGEKCVTLEKDGLFLQRTRGCSPTFGDSQGLPSVVMFHISIVQRHSPGLPGIGPREETPFPGTRRTGPSPYISKADMKAAKNIWKGEITEGKLLTDLILGCLIGKMYERGSAHYLLVN